MKGSAPPSEIVTLSSAADNHCDVVTLDGGFIVVTAFTNWQKTFCGDSMHENAFSCEEDDKGRAYT